MPFQVVEFPAYLSIIVFSGSASETQPKREDSRLSFSKLKKRVAALVTWSG